MRADEAVQLITLVADVAAERDEQARRADAAEAEVRRLSDLLKAWKLLAEARQQNYSVLADVIRSGVDG